MAHGQSRTGLKRVGQNLLASTYSYGKTKKVEIPWSPQEGGQTMFIETKADITVYGGAAGSGKTSALLMSCADRRKMKVKGYNATVFRVSNPQITNPGGLLDESRLLYEDIGGKVTSKPLDWTFEKSAYIAKNVKISFRHIQYEKDVKNYQGAQICLLCFDELTHFSEQTFFYMISRNRSGCGVKPQVKCTCNPDADSWVAELISWWIDEETGLPIKERRGVIRYFVRIENEKKESTMYWADTKEELIEEHGDRYYKTYKQKLRPKSFTFIYGTIEDNKKLLAVDPDYMANLQALHPVERERLLRGNWKIRLEAGTIFDRNWFIEIDAMPDLSLYETQEIAFWDFASTSKETANTTAEFNRSYYTARVKMLMCQGNFYVTHVQWRRIKGGNIYDWVSETAKIDGEHVKICWELEGGSAGNIVAADFKEKLLEENPNYVIHAVKPQGDKVMRAIKAATAASNGKMHVLKSDWTNEYLNSLQDFDGSRQPLINDVTDATSGAYNELDGSTSYHFDEDNMSYEEDYDELPFDNFGRNHHNYFGNTYY